MDSFALGSTLVPRMKATEPRSRHGLNAPMARVKIRGLDSIDRRTAAARGLLALRRALIADLGGEDRLSTQERVLIDLVTRTKLFLDALDGWLLTQPSLVNGRRRALVPALRERGQLADALARYVSMLGRGRERPDGTGGVQATLPEGGFGDLSTEEVLTLYEKEFGGITPDEKRRILALDVGHGDRVPTAQPQPTSALPRQFSVVSVPPTVRRQGAEGGGADTARPKT